MNDAPHVSLCKRLLAQVAGPIPADAGAFEIAVRDYVSPERFGEERDRVFRRCPTVVATEAELAGPGACVAVELGGVSVLVVRGHDGELRAFRNACRHRGAELVSGCDVTTTRAFVCPYHGWTYDLAGRRVRADHAESFAGCDAARRELVPAFVAARHGLVLASLAPFDANTWLAPLAPDLAAWDPSGHRVHRRSSREVRANWKLVIDAFLEAYHIRRLHRDSVSPFFLDARSEAERAGPHVRSVTARRAIVEAREASLRAEDVRQLATPSYLIFPNTIFVVHPDWLSVVTVTPLAPDRSRFVHAMLLPPPPLSPDDEAHFARSFALIDERVFAGEDLIAAEAVQRGLAATGDETLLFGALEIAALWFHEEIAARISAASQ